VSVLGLDIGGANLKAAHVSGTAHLHPFELWKHPHGLVDALQELIRQMPAADTLAVTMTGELCDCFSGKREGVHCILDAVEAVADRRRIRVWRTEGDFVDLDRARTIPLQVAAANWLALAAYAGRLAPRGPALLLDIGSTSTDIVPLLDGRPVPEARSDPDRLRAEELVYVGVRRTPVCALGGRDLAAEFFATTLDVFLVLGSIPEDEADLGTADFRPATRAAAHARLARMVCADLETSTPQQREELARRVASLLVGRLASALKTVAKRLPAPPRVALLAGSGEFLARRVLDEQDAFVLLTVESLSKRLGSAISQAACAYAVAVLATEQAHDG
jgi:probable H4MPT-linked C1 transfer pathway protein